MRHPVASVQRNIELSVRPVVVEPVAGTIPPMKTTCFEASLAAHAPTTRIYDSLGAQAAHGIPYKDPCRTARSPGPSHQGLPAHPNARTTLLRQSQAPERQPTVNASRPYSIYEYRHP